MSGAGAGGYMPPQRANYDCTTSITITTVSSIDLLVLEKQKVGTFLDVILHTNDALILEDGNGEILGSVLHLNTGDIINCIKQGARYRAKIINLNSPSCKIEIRSI